MRKALLVLTLATCMLFVVQVFEAEAAQYEDITITVSMATTLSVDLSSHNIDFGAVAAGSTTVSSNAIAATNDGSGSDEVFTLSHSTSGDWTSGTTPGPETFVLNAAFADDAASATWTHVDSTMSDSVGHSDPGNLWFQFQAPTASASTTPQMITVTVTAQLP